MDTIDRLTTCLQLDINVIEVRMNAVNVAILLDYILHEIMKVGP